MKTNILDIQFDNLTREEARQAGAELLRSSDFHYAVTPNPEFILTADKDLEFQKILNGTHTITIEASDGKASATFTATFTKAVHKATITLKTPLAVSGDITAAVMSVVGQIPAGAVYKVEATNNAKDTSPVWQDVTAEVKSGANIVFTNKKAANGAAFNFRITVERGTSAGGYISGVSGAFQ